MENMGQYQQLAITYGTAIVTKIIAAILSVDAFLGAQELSLAMRHQGTSLRYEQILCVAAQIRFLNHLRTCIT